MRPLTRKRRILKWAGLVACCLLLVAIVVSQWWHGYWNSWHFRCSIMWSAFHFSYYAYDFDFRWLVYRHTGDAGFIKWFIFFPVTEGYVYIIPLWMPLVLIAVPTLLAWRRDRRIPPGHCRKCRYDLTGNESGVCPECGTEVPKP